MTIHTTKVTCDGDSPMHELTKRCARAPKGIVAKDLGIAANVLSDILVGRRPITPKIANRLGFTLVWKRIS